MFGVFRYDRYQLEAVLGTQYHSLPCSPLVLKGPKNPGRGLRTWKLDGGEGIENRDAQESRSGIEIIEGFKPSLVKFKES